MTIYSLDVLLVTVCCSTSSPKCCFLICIQISQRQIRWSGIPISYTGDFPQFIVTHTVKGFGIINKAEVDVFLELLLFWWCSRHWHFDLFPLPFLKPAWTSGSASFTYCISLAWRIFSIILLGCEMNATMQSFEHSLALPLFGIGMRTDLFQSCGHCWAFQICWHIECSTFTAPSYRIWNSSTGFPSPPLALFVVMLPKAHLTSHSRMSGSRWVITPSWFSGLWRSFFVQVFCVFLPTLLNIFCSC